MLSRKMPVIVVPDGKPTVTVLVDGFFTGAAMMILPFGYCGFAAA
jgi:hypothetical protein